MPIPGFADTAPLWGEMTQEERDALAFYEALLGGGDIPGIPQGWQPNESLLSDILGLMAAASGTEDLSRFERRYTTPLMGGGGGQTVQNALTDYLAARARASEAGAPPGGLLGRMGYGGYNVESLQAIGPALADLVAKWPNDAGVQAAYRAFMSRYGGQMGGQPTSIWGAVAAPYLTMAQQRPQFAAEAPGATFPSSLRGLPYNAQQSLRDIGQAALGLQGKWAGPQGVAERPINVIQRFINLVRGQRQAIPATPGGGGGGGGATGAAGPAQPGMGKTSAELQQNAYSALRQRIEMYRTAADAFAAFNRHEAELREALGPELFEKLRADIAARPGTQPGRLYNPKQADGFGSWLQQWR